MLETVQSVRWLPLTPAQFDFWEEFSFHPHQPVSTVAHRITLRGEIDEPGLLAALEQVVAETDVFTIQFQLPDNDDLPLQRCNPQLRPRVRLIELQQTDVAESMMQVDIERQLNLLSQPLAVVWLIRFSPTHYTVYIRAHHIIIDGFGMALIEHRLAELYRARLQKNHR
ncbi:Dimodular nonribosomal peptide synthase [Serratia fonticola]|uniref:Dimodular nonribosomal peptide synthase n=1 Tax=Serratia fonticola TaxID=47917 RepID=A0A4U9VK55_SERFO|nr:Dimodular nonribosomal peptide synthase [Serratia fonticola]